MMEVAVVEKPRSSEVDRNFEAFQKVLPEILQSHQGKFAIIHNAEIVEYCDTLSDAVRLGRLKFGDISSFSVQEVTSQNVNLGYYAYAVQHVCD